MRNIGSLNRNGRVIYVNSIEDPWLGVSVLPKDKPDQLWFLDRLGGPKFIEQGLNGPTDAKYGAESIIIKCQDCSHCQELSAPNAKTDSKALKDGRNTIAKWLTKFIKE